MKVDIRNESSLLIWKHLRHASQEIKRETLHQLFQKTPKRADIFHIRHQNLLLDYSKQKVNLNVMQRLSQLAKNSRVISAFDNMMSGAVVNQSEGRSALHTALRLPQGQKLVVKGEDITQKVHTTLHAMELIVHKLHAGYWRGCTGEPITDVVNIGVGGSDLGPFFACQALHEFVPENAQHLQVHFVSSMDGIHIDRLLKKLNPATTLFIVASKSFKTPDTLGNAKIAKAWLHSLDSEYHERMKHHFIGVSSSAERMTEFGIQHQLPVFDWVGGRFSLWSAIGLPIAIKLGMKHFRELLAGAHAIDQHVINAPIANNIPLTMGLIAVWNASFLDIHAHTILPYDERMRHLPGYLSQLEMESNGKAVTHDGQIVASQTSPIVWGNVGANAQHAYFQLLHQGTHYVSSDFIAPISRYENATDITEQQRALQEQEKLMLANCITQSRLLAFGDQIKDGDSTPHLKYRGDQPSSTLLMDRLTPYNLGSLLAIYEHKVFVMATLWNINPFDQWGVEMGKRMAQSMLADIQNPQDSQQSHYDSSSALLLNAVKKQNHYGSSNQS
ncbi:glucose-6-phosphate isomerase [Pleionea sp. CnH1-48]|uniref:glucose-6-phosphate isomerase n=1 Tax=Pleionea sp. CnH1-48 TaxID=2954494 RepID=UPI00209840BF|nr:glucose-6-phosphate isomerase [Pleionea sp. CnH1-48]MCO7226137.1 glucose-6-phosphate isomerase [Pleionea sp. CnH1-48]